MRDAAGGVDVKAGALPLRSEALNTLRNKAALTPVEITVMPAPAFAIGGCHGL